MWNAYKREHAPWAYEVSKCAGQEALRDLRQAFDNFFASRSGKRAGPKVGFPRYRKKGRDDRFRLTGSIHVGPRGVQLPKIGWVRTKESTAKFRGRILSARVRREADRWYVSVAAERADPKPKAGGAVGVDLGLKAFAVLSDGTVVKPSRFLARSERMLRRKQKALSRKRKGSRRRRKAAMAVARLHQKIANRRRDFHHKLSTALTRTKSVVVVDAIQMTAVMALWLSYDRAA